MPEDAVPLRYRPGPRPSKRRPSPTPGRRLRSAARVVLGVLGPALTVLGFVRFTDTFEEVRDHYAAPACTAAARPGDDCTRQESGRVTKKREPAADSDSTGYLLTVARETAPTGEQEVGKAFYDDVAPVTPWT